MHSESAPDSSTLDALSLFIPPIPTIGNLNSVALRSFITFIDEGVVSFLVIVSNKLPIAT